MRSKRILFAFLLTAVFYSCSDKESIVPLNEPVKDPVNEPIEYQTFGIRHDRTLADYEAAVTATIDRPDFGAVIMFSYTIAGKDYLASGTLITPDWILTAGHNFYDKKDKKTTAKPANILVLTGNNPNSPEQTLDVVQLYFHPTWIQDNEDFVYANDLCLVKLKTSVKNITPAQLYTGTEEPIGSKVWFAGFGDYSATKGQDTNLFSKKHAIENILDRKISGILTKINGLTFNGGLLAFDFDSPTGRINTLGDDYVGEDEALLGPGSSSASPLNLEGGTVAGDSGGPLFIKDNGVWKLAGVLSGGALGPFVGHKASDYGDISMFIRVSNVKSWIGEIVK